jgi:N-acetylmuramoyl-L-alanine amidase
MSKKTLYFLLSFFSVLTLLSFTQENKSSVKTIIIDPGHGGIDGGAPGLFSTEAEVSLAVGMLLGEVLAKDIPDIKVLFTRTTDIIPGNSRNKSEGLRYRANFANRSKADLFISIHCNSAGKAPGGWNEKRVVDYQEKVSYVKKKKKKVKVVKKVPVYETFYVQNTVKGTETFIWTAKENSHKGQIVGDNSEFAEYGDDSTLVMPENDPVLKAMQLVYTKKYFLKSLKLAELVQDEFTNRGRVNRGVKQRNDVGIWVLHATGMPSILVETGFITNKEEEEYLNSKDGQQEIVKDISNAVKKYFEGLENQKKGNENPVESVSNNIAAILIDNRNLLSRKFLVIA